MVLRWLGVIGTQAPSLWASPAIAPLAARHTYDPDLMSREFPKQSERWPPIDAMLLEYRTIEQEKTQLQRMMFTVINIAASGAAALAALSMQLQVGDVLILIAPVLLFGGVFVVVLRLYVQRLAAYASAIEDDMNRLTGATLGQFMWEGTAGGKEIRTLGPNTRLIRVLLAALSALLIGVTGFFLWLGTSLISTWEFAREVANRSGVQPEALAAVYSVVGGVLLFLIVFLWLGSPTGFTRSRALFQAARSVGGGRLSGVDSTGHVSSEVGTPVVATASAPGTDSDQAPSEFAHESSQGRQGKASTQEQGRG